MKGKKIAEYKLILSETENTGSLAGTINRLNDIVEENIMKGWQPFGSPSISGEDVVQAMVKCENVSLMEPNPFLED